MKRNIQPIEKTSSKFEESFRENKIFETAQGSVVMDFNQSSKTTNYIYPYQLYSWMVNNLKTLSNEEQSRTIDTLKSVEWVKSELDDLTTSECVQLEMHLAQCIDNKEFALDLLSITAISFNLKLRKINTFNLDSAINLSKRLNDEINRLLNV